jgi:hypothetical protein
VQRSAAQSRLHRVSGSPLIADCSARPGLQSAFSVNLIASGGVDGHVAGAFESVGVMVARSESFCEHKQDPLRAYIVLPRFFLFFSHNRERAVELVFAATRVATCPVALLCIDVFLSS